MADASLVSKLGVRGATIVANDHADSFAHACGSQIKAGLNRHQRSKFKDKKDKDPKFKGGKKEDWHPLDMGRVLGTTSTSALVLA